MRITARFLAKLLSEELEADNWGDIDPWCIRRVAECGVEDVEDSHYLDVETMRAALARVADRLNATVTTALT